MIIQGYKLGTLITILDYVSGDIIYNHMPKGKTIHISIQPFRNVQILHIHKDYMPDSKLIMHALGWERVTLEQVKDLNYDGTTIKKRGVRVFWGSKLRSWLMDMFRA